VTPALEISGVLKDFIGLRPLRIDSLSVSPGEQVAVLGLDAASAEILVNLITGTTLPDHGEIRVLGELTSSIRDSDAWMAFVDRMGIVSERAVLLDALSVLQNLAIPFSLDVETLGPDLRSRAESLAAQVGIGSAAYQGRVGDLDSADRVRVKLGRALALEPALVLIEHPSSGVTRDRVASLGRDLKGIVASRGAAGLTLTADKELAHAIADRTLQLDPATGRLADVRTTWLNRLMNR
jgi:ABC-type transporter Mla maintaining outer membrane lipid asymmetry ATPase subunit MlaF